MNQSKFIFKRDSYDQPIYTDVFYKPPSKRHVSAPIAIALHGGGFVIGSKDMIPRPQIQHLVELGFVVVAPNYRLCPTISLYDGPLKDVKDCYKWAQIDLPKLLGEEITIDPEKITTLGYSAGATLALLLATTSQTPCAVAAFYGALYFNDSFWHSPLPALSQFPAFDQDFLSLIYEEKDPSASAASLDHPDLSNPRTAWLFTALKEGRHIRDIVKDGQYDRVDPAYLFSSQFPPTIFIHGTADTIIDSRFSVDAHAALKELGVGTELVLVKGKNHAFDEPVKEGDSDWEDIRVGLNFLARHI